MTNNIPPQAAAVLEYTREELGRADSKAGILLAVNGIGVGAILNKASSSGALPYHLNPFIAISWWLAVMAVTVSSGFLVAAIKPRINRDYASSAGRIAYFGDVRRLSSPGDLVKILRQSQNDWLEALADQIWHVSHLCQIKYQYINRGLWLMASGWAIFVCVTFVDLATQH
ncbi:Pycsar system effector family protein [Streptosporangium sp. NPDC006930]|uniref:Pycsar system effector family protein n=1 Tax=Streptosporangium sp. NPDC006930 TaxID=3154783 RepID=UPI00344756C7